MYLVQTNSLIEEDRAQLISEPCDEELDKVLQASKLFFKVFSLGRPVILGGVIASSLLSVDCYVWAKLCNPPYGLGELKHGIQLGRAFLEKLPYEVKAETLPNDMKANKFVRCFDFSLLTTDNTRCTHVLKVI